MSDYVGLLATLVLLLLNAFFVGAEFALISARRSSIEPLAQQGDRRAQVTLGAMENVSLMMATAQLGITVTGLLVGYVAEPLIGASLGVLLGGVNVPPAVSISASVTPRAWRWWTSVVHPAGA